MVQVPRGPYSNIVGRHAAFPYLINLGFLQRQSDTHPEPLAEPRPAKGGRVPADVVSSPTSRPGPSSTGPVLEARAQALSAL